MNPDFGNIASTLEKQAQEIPDVPALHVLKGAHCDSVSFSQLEQESRKIAAGLDRLGVGKGTRVLVMVSPGIEFTAATFALFKTGAVPVLIDPGLGKESVLKGIEEAAPTVMIGVAKAHIARLLYQRSFKSIETNITVGTKWFWGGHTLEQVKQLGERSFETTPTRSDDPAAILFTSGSTGPAKGVLYTHAMFLNQVEAIRKLYGIRQKDVELPTFPLFALFAVGMGMTCVIPDMDPTRPAQVDPVKIVRAVKQFKVVSSFGSPALWDTVSRYCLKNNLCLPGLKRILMAGAPVSGKLLKSFDSILDADAKIFTPYGATESLPLASIERSEILNATWEQSQQGKGFCVGQPVDGVAVKIIGVTDEPIERWENELEISRGEIGEIVVKSPWTTREYFRREEATRLSKIQDGDSFWHRMGDVGYLDDQNRLWFCGRKSQRVVTEKGVMFTIPCEAIFNRRPEVRRSALVGVGKKSDQQAAIVIQPEDPAILNDATRMNNLKSELMQQAEGNPLTKDIKHLLFHPDFPVDVRHNAKIFREKLAVWAEVELRKNG